MIVSCLQCYKTYINKYYSGLNSLNLEDFTMHVSYGTNHLYSPLYCHVDLLLFSLKFFSYMKVTKIASQFLLVRREQ